ncbi:MAG TPA: hypothetical protein PLK13_08505 [Xanthobacteraceae bacterium]|nr:hypothetical protein [Xanthobacteraceae bacterium]HQS48039.1 hypothetical protein [Xanthobacteraceae bacterium]
MRAPDIFLADAGLADIDYILAKLYHLRPRIQLSEPWLSVESPRLAKENIRLAAAVAPQAPTSKESTTFGYDK